jgi:EmrB/QacA subfamily drug resistance transporter
VGRCRAFCAGMGNTLPMKPFGRALPLTIATAFFMEQLDSSVINTALPAIAHDLGTSIPQLAFSITAYLISLAVFMPLGGWLADRYGGRRVFMSALAIFAAGSLLCGLAPNNFSLIVGRIVQGMGGAMMAPVGRAILMSSVSKSEYVRAMNYVIMPALIGPAVGPLVGGFLATYISWHWIFLINLPLAAIGIGMSLRFMPAKVAEGDGKPKPLDWIGYGFLIVALGTGQFAIEIFGHAAHRLGALEVGLLSASATALFLWRYRRIGSGILDLGLLRIRTFRLSITAGSIARAGIGGIPFLLPLLLQVGFGYNAFQAGLVTFLVAIGSAVIRPIMSFTLKWWGCRRIILANSFITALGLLGFLMFRPGTSLWFMSPYVFLFGLLRSSQMSTINALTYADIEKCDMSRASTIGTLAQRLSIGIGVNVAASVLNISSQGHTPDLSAFAWAFIATSSLVLVGGIMFIRLHPTDGWQISNRTAP